MIDSCRYFEYIDLKNKYLVIKNYQKLAALCLGNDF
jgi:hypothetical protein